MIVISIISVMGCRSGPEPIMRIDLLEDKGTLIGAPTPDWVVNYITHGVSRVQAQREFSGFYAIVGEERGINLSLTLALADNFSAQQRIGAMLRTTIASEYQARVQGAAQSVGGGVPSAAEQLGGSIQYEIDSIINTIVNVSFSGARREADWWQLRRRHDPDLEGVFQDEYVVFVLYLIPRAELNRQVAHALETSVSMDSALYEVTIEIARNLLLEGMANWGESSED